ncbi:bestrophin family protein [Bordetella bronchialis]|uniref:Bestrophin n=1 Tax=Bordetella bronchialis TaxID=463025 RepID=A0ABM6CVE3_9BORD|nr:bestrophin family ion channel [Bordetella bronchialis]ANN68114.1 hypothetical protein BAU06_19045 [Bordetella bronchialis]
MIVRRNHNWFRMLFVWDGSVLQAILPQLGLMAALGLLAVWTHGRLLGERVPLNTAPFTLAGVALTIFLAFRNTASYERYCEARHLWGQVAISSRALVSQALNYASPDPAVFDRQAFVQGLIAFVYALKHQLRGTDPAADLRRLLGPDQANAVLRAEYRPVAILNEARRVLGEQQRQGKLRGTGLWMLDGQLNELGAMLGGCERIASTPIPYPYGVLLHRTVYIYCALLPFCLVSSIGGLTPVVSVFVSYTLIALEAIAGEIAEPFGTAPNSLALDAMTRSIERSLLELCGKEIPPAPRPDPRYRLS